MTRTIIFRPAAAQEFREAVAWYEEKQVGLGLQFEDEVDRALARILDNPFSKIWRDRG